MTGLIRMTFKRHAKDFSYLMLTDRPMLFEVFTSGADEAEAIEQMRGFGENLTGKIKQLVKDALKNES